MAAPNQVAIEYECNSFRSFGKQLYLTEDTADFHFIFESDDGEFKRVPAHKLLLGASDVLRTMFNGTWKEISEVLIVDSSLEAFKEFLQFFYLEKVKLTDDNVIDVMNLGNKYNVTECVDLCRRFLKTNLTNYNVCSVYGVAMILDDDQLKDFCERIIRADTKNIFNASSFLQCNRKVLINILKFDWLSCTEAEVFESCMKWIKANSGQEQLTHDLVHNEYADLIDEIRFGSMTFEMFTVLDQIHGHLFTPEECREIIHMIASSNFKPTSFRENRRRCRPSVKWNETAKLVCDRTVLNNNTTYYIKSVETTAFSVNKPLWLGNIGCLRIGAPLQNTFGDNLLLTKITIVEISTDHFRPESSAESILYKVQTNLSNVNITIIPIPMPILIKPGNRYEIRMKQSLPPNYCTTILLKSEVTIGDVVVKFHNDTDTSEENIAGGLVLGLQFNNI